MSGTWIRVAAVTIALAALVGCDVDFGGSKPPADPAPPRRDPAAEAAKLRDEIRQTYREAGPTGRFESLADFERHGDVPGARQVENFLCLPTMGAVSKAEFSYDAARTGTGGLAVTLDPGTRLVFTAPGSANISAYTLVSFAVRSEELRDDLTVILSSDKGLYTSPRILVQPGWNDVLVDIQRLGHREDFNTDRVLQISLEFADAASPVRFDLDDILLIDNRRAIRPSPPGLSIRKAGLDYALAAEGVFAEVPLAQSPDGLWRFGDRQPKLRLAGPGQALPPRGPEALERLGERRVGRVELVECNPVRLRLVNTWYFPTRAGQWASMGVRHVQWTHTIYADDRRVTSVQLNNAGGQAIGKVAIDLDRAGAWAGGPSAESLTVESFAGPVGRWSVLQTPTTPDGQAQQANYLAPVEVRPTMGRLGVGSSREAFDPAQGCHVLTADRGHCRFTIAPGGDPAVRPIFRVHGPFAGDIRINSQGLGIRNFVLLDDGSVLFVMPGRLTQPTAVEVRGRPRE